LPVIYNIVSHFHFAIKKQVFEEKITMGLFSILSRKLQRNFFKAVCEGSVEYVKDLIDQGADVNCRDDVYLWSKEQKDTVFYREGERGNEYYRKKCGRTALGFAVVRDYVELVELLCERGADVNAVTLRSEMLLLSESARNITPLMEVIGDSPNEVKITQILIDHGAHINFKRFRWHDGHS
jgi:ankyrin repeat protein